MTSAPLKTTRTSGIFLKEMTSGRNMSSYSDWTTCTNLYHQFLQWPCTPSKNQCAMGRTLPHWSCLCLKSNLEAIHLFCTNGPHTIAFSGQNCGYLVNGLPKPVRLGVRGLFAHICLGHQRVKWHKPAFKVESGTICWQSRQNFTWNYRRGRCHTWGICLFRLKTEIAALKQFSGYSHFGWSNRTKPDSVGSHLCLTC